MINTIGNEYIIINARMHSALQVLQCSVDRELSLYSDIKERTNLVAEVGMLSLSSQPVDHEDNGQRKHTSSDVGQCIAIC